MNEVTRRISFLVSLSRSFDLSFVGSLLRVVWRIIASVNALSRRELSPRSFERFERRLERFFRELARLLIEQTVNHLESSDRPTAIQWDGGRTLVAHRRFWRTMETRLGTIRYQRWVFQHELPWVPSVAPLDLRLGLIGQRVSPGVAHKMGRLAADLPQQPALQQLREQFGITLSVEAYRRIVQHISIEIRFLHDRLAVDELLRWIAEARQSTGKHEVLLLVGRDGVHVPMRQSWKEAGCATLAVYDRNRKRLGTVYLGEMPQKNQVALTERLTKVITEVLSGDCDHPLKLRYVTDAGGLPRSYFQKVLAKMKHPRTGEPLQWSWGVDFYHTCQYISLLADTIFGVGTEEAQSWFRDQRHTLRHNQDGVKKILASSAQKKRRHGLAGSLKDYQSGRGYLKRYRKFMDYADRQAAGDPIGSGVTEAGCKVIFNQRMKQSGMRWKRASGQWIVDLRTACRSGLWDKIWKYGLDDYRLLPDIQPAIPLPALTIPRI